MHLACEKKVTIRDTVIGGPDLLICVPLVTTDEKGLLQQARTALQHKPNLFEWRADAFTQMDQETCRDILAALRDVIGDSPLIFTCRRHAEGGFNKISADEREGLINAAIQSGNVDIVDMELSNDEIFIQNLRKAAINAGLSMMLSYHNFKSTPEPENIIATLLQARNRGADIAKVAVMPREFEDVLTLMNAALKARKNGLKIPMIAISMGILGRLTRFAGGFFGSNITFASSASGSAPGQVSIQALQQTLTALNQR